MSLEKRGPYEKNLVKIDHIHFFVEDAPRQREWLVRCLGWDLVGHQQLQDRAIEVLRYRDALFVLTSPCTSDSPVATYLQAYAPGVVDIAIEVDSLASMLNRPQAPQLVREPHQDHLPLLDQLVAQEGAIAPSTSVCAKGWGRLHHTIIERSLPMAARRFPPQATSPQSISPQSPFPQAPSPQAMSSQGIDHIVLNVAQGELQAAVAFYEEFWGMEKRQQFNIQTEHSGLNSQVLWASTPQIYFNINEPTSDKSQIQIFIDANRGAGIQHIALHSAPIVPMVRALRQRGTPFLSVPQTYYRQIEQRLQTCQSRPIHPQEWQQIIKQQILLDWPPDTPDTLLLQIFSQPIFKENHFFLEFIERRRSVEGFGEGNFLALYQAIEAEMRGVDDPASLTTTGIKEGHNVLQRRSYRHPLPLPQYNSAQVTPQMTSLKPHSSSQSTLAKEGSSGPLPLQGNVRGGGLTGLLPRGCNHNGSDEQ